MVLSGQAAVFGALLLGISAKLARGRGAEGEGVLSSIISAAKARSLSLASLLVPGNIPLKNTLKALSEAGEDAASLSSSYPEIQALSDLNPSIQATARSGDATALLSAVESLPSNVRSEALARGITGEAVLAALRASGNDKAEFSKVFSPFVSVLKLASGGTSNAETTILHGAHVSTAVKLKQDIDEGEEDKPSLYSDVFSVLESLGVVSAQSIASFSSK